MRLSLLTVFLALAIFSTAHAQTDGSPIRNVDFANFTYPIHSELRVFGSPRRTFTVRDGKFAGGNGAVGMAFYKTTYGDVTGDGRDDAIVELSVDTDGGTAVHAAVYIYRWHHNRPQFLWSFVSGDRADGGLRGSYPDNGQLVIELYGKGTRIGGKLYGTEDVGACCPRFVTRTRYTWRRGAFRRAGSSDVFPNPDRPPAG